LRTDDSSRLDDRSPPSQDVCSRKLALVDPSERPTTIRLDAGEEKLLESLTACSIDETPHEPFETMTLQTTEIDLLGFHS
jgi:hypothetical protein